MSLFLSARQCALPLIVGLTTTLSLVTSPAFASPPEVIVDGAKNGQMRLDNPVQLAGAARDNDGIKTISGSIQNVRTGNFITEDGRGSKTGASIPIKFDKKRSTRWRTQSFNLPRGEYLFRIRVSDANNNASDLLEIPFIATGTKGTNLAATPSTNQRATQQASAAPRTAIQFPKNGSTLQQAAAFAGIAQDDQAVVGVVATILNTATGMYLSPNGKFAKSGQFQLRTVRGKNAQWSTPQVDLPPGNYLLSVKAVDNNGQDGQWAQSQFTVAAKAQPSKPAVATTAVAAGGKAANGLSYCSGSGADADGDGFGWQNEASCVVAGSKADTHPTCASSASDPDGDGYGWENEKSCIVVTHCQSAASDADGDGFGWENERSCIVLKQTNNSGFANCRQGAASDPDGDGYGWENNKTCLVR